MNCKTLSGLCFENYMTNGTSMVFFMAIFLGNSAASTLRRSAANDIDSTSNLKTKVQLKRTLEY